MAIVRAERVRIVAIAKGEMGDIYFWEVRMV
jgi:hypothetical protein